MEIVAEKKIHYYYDSSIYCCRRRSLGEKEGIFNIFPFLWSLLAFGCILFFLSFFASRRCGAQSWRVRNDFIATKLTYGWIKLMNYKLKAIGILINAVILIFCFCGRWLTSVVLPTLCLVKVPSFWFYCKNNFSAFIIRCTAAYICVCTCVLIWF